MKTSARMPALLACLADPSRYRVLNVMLEGDYCVSEIATRIGLSQSCTTRHLQTLQRAGILTRTRAGKRVLFRIQKSDPELDHLLELFLVRRRREARTAPSEGPATEEVRAGDPGSTARNRAAGTAVAGGRRADAVSIPLPAVGVVASDAPAVTDSPSDIAESADSLAGAAPSRNAVDLEDYLL